MTHSWINEPLILFTKRCHTGNRPLKIYLLYQQLQGRWFMFLCQDSRCRKLGDWAIGLIMCVSVLLACGSIISLTIDFWAYTLPPSVQLAGKKTQLWMNWCIEWKRGWLWRCVPWIKTIALSNWCKMDMESKQNYVFCQPIALIKRHPIVKC